MNTHVEARAPVASAGDFARSATIETIGTNVLRYALVLIFVLFGSLKFSAAEAAAIKPLVSNSPFMSWMYSILSDQAVSAVIGTTELIAAALIAVRPFSARISHRKADGAGGVGHEGGRAKTGLSAGCEGANRAVSACGRSAA